MTIKERIIPSGLSRAEHFTRGLIATGLSTLIIAGASGGKELIEATRDDDRAAQLRLAGDYSGAVKAYDASIDNYDNAIPLLW